MYSNVYSNQRATVCIPRSEGSYGVGCCFLPSEIIRLVEEAPPLAESSCRPLFSYFFFLKTGSGGFGRVRVDSSPVYE